MAHINIEHQAYSLEVERVKKVLLKSIKLDLYVYAYPSQIYYLYFITTQLFDLMINKIQHKREDLSNIGIACVLETYKQIGYLEVDTKEIVKVKKDVDNNDMPEFTDNPRVRIIHLNYFSQRHISKIKEKEGHYYQSIMKFQNTISNLSTGLHVPHLFTTPGALLNEIISSGCGHILLPSITSITLEALAIYATKKSLLEVPPLILTQICMVVAKHYCKAQNIQINQKFGMSGGFAAAGLTRERISDIFNFLNTTLQQDKSFLNQFQFDNNSKYFEIDLSANLIKPKATYNMQALTTPVINVINQLFSDCDLMKLAPVLETYFMESFCNISWKWKNLIDGSNRQGEILNQDFNKMIACFEKGGTAISCKELDSYVDQIVKAIASYKEGFKEINSDYEKCVGILIDQLQKCCKGEIKNLEERLKQLQSFVSTKLINGALSKSFNKIVSCLEKYRDDISKLRVEYFDADGNFKKSSLQPQNKKISTVIALLSYNKANITQSESSNPIFAGNTPVNKEVSNFLDLNITHGRNEISSK